MPRIATTLDQEHYELIKELAKKNKRSISAQSAYMLESQLDKKENQITENKK